MLAIAAVLVARAVVVYGLRLAINRRPPPVPLKWGHVMVWGGMRGAVSIALALSLVQPLEARQRLIALVFGCVIFSVVGQGLTILPLLDRLGLTRRGEARLAFERSLARMTAAQASIQAVEQATHQFLLSRPMARRLTEQFEKQVEEYSQEVTRLVARTPELAGDNVRLVRDEIGHTQKQSLRRLLRQGIISEEVYAEFVAGIDENLRHPATGDWGLAAHLKDALHDRGLEGQTDDAARPGETEEESASTA